METGWHPTVELYRADVPEGAHGRDNCNQFYVFRFLPERYLLFLGSWSKHEQGGVGDDGEGDGGEGGEGDVEVAEHDQHWTCRGPDQPRTMYDWSPDRKSLHWKNLQGEHVKIIIMHLQCVVSAFKPHSTQTFWCSIVLTMINPSLETLNKNQIQIHDSGHQVYHKYRSKTILIHRVLMILYQGSTCTPNKMC